MGFCFKFLTRRHWRRTRSKMLLHFVCFSFVGKVFNWQTSIRFKIQNLTGFDGIRHESVPSCHGFDFSRYKFQSAHPSENMSRRCMENGQVLLWRNSCESEDDLTNLSVQMTSPTAENKKVRVISRKACLMIKEVFSSMKKGLLPELPPRKRSFLDFYKLIFSLIFPTVEGWFWFFGNWFSFQWKSQFFNLNSLQISWL